MAAPDPINELSNLSRLERELLLRLQSLDQRHAAELQLQNQSIRALQDKMLAQEAAVTRLTDLLTSLLAPQDRRQS